MNFLPFLIAQKFFFNKNKKYTELLISILPKIGISISIFALIMSLSALNGFQILLNKTILSSLPHGIIQLPNTSTLLWKDLIKKLQFFPDIIYSEPYIVDNGLILSNNHIELIEIKSFSNIKYLKKKFL